MPRANRMHQTFDVVPLTSDTWNLFEHLFGREQGANGGCWCMWWRLPRSRFNAMTRSERREAQKRRVAEGRSTGVMLLHDREAVGWCAVAPRGDVPTLDRSNISKPTGVAAAWCISCFFIKAGFRRRGLMQPLILGAVRYAGENGATAVEAFPQEAAGRSGYIDTFVGVASVFRRCGFAEVERRGAHRVAMRLELSVAHTKTR